MTNHGGWRGRTAGGVKLSLKSSFKLLTYLLATLVLLSIATERVVASAHSVGAGVAAEVEIDADGTTKPPVRDAQRTREGVADGSESKVDADLLLLPPLLGALFGEETAPHASDDGDAGFPIPALVDAWESHPLLATSRPLPPPSDCETDADGGCQPPTAAASKIPTVHRPGRDLGAAIGELLDLSDDTPTAGGDDGRNPLLGLGVDDVFESILSQPDLEHGLSKDFTVLKKIVRDGQEWSGVVPKDRIPPDEARGAISQYGFSLVINRVEERWGPAARFARALEAETMPGSISCNLYLTPGADEAGGNPAESGGNDGAGEAVGRVSGFEVHYDWMDVVVLQISGEKTWTVASTPLTYLSTSDLKRKPTPREVRAYAHGDGGDNGGHPPSRYDDFVLRPGDALYIPRGFLHNASTVNFADEPSLHLTFGLEHHCRTTVEALIHHALLLFYGGDDDGSVTDVVAVPGDECSGGGGKGVTWLDLLDLSVADVVRRDCGKVKPEGGTGVQQRDRGCGMRRSVPLHPAWRRMLGGRENNRGGTEEARGTPDVPSTNTSTSSDAPVDDIIWTMYTDGLDAYRKSADLGGAIGYPKFLRVSPDIKAKFCFPTRDAGAAIDVILACESALPRFVSEDRFREEVEKFHGFARDRDRLRAALGAFERGTTARRVQVWDEKKSALKSVGHGQYA